MSPGILSRRPRSAAGGVLLAALLGAGVPSAFAAETGSSQPMSGTAAVTGVDHPTTQDERDRALLAQRTGALRDRFAQLEPVIQAGGPAGERAGAEISAMLRNQATINLVTAQNRYIRASALMDQANGLMRRANTSDFNTALQGPAGDQWAKTLSQLGGDGWTLDDVKAVVAQGSPTLAGQVQLMAAVLPATMRPFLPKGD